MTVDGQIQEHQKRGDRALANEFFSKAFWEYMRAEGLGTKKEYARPSQMAIAGQLNKTEIKALLLSLEGEYQLGNPRATLHYGLVLNYLKKYSQAIEVYKKAYSLGIVEAIELISQLETMGN